MSTTDDTSTSASSAAAATPQAAEATTATAAEAAAAAVAATTEEEEEGGGGGGGATGGDGAAAAHDADDEAALRALAGELPRREKVFGREFVIRQEFASQDLAATAWDASLVLVHFFENVQKFPLGYFAGKRVLELGAGTGIVSAVLAALGAEVWATDLPHVLPLLAANARLNRVQDRMRPRPLTWGDTAATHALVDEARALLLRGGGKKKEKQNKGEGEELSPGAAAVAAAAAKAAAERAEDAADEGGSPPEVPSEAFDMVICCDVIANCYADVRADLLKTLTDACDDKTVLLMAHELRDARDLQFFRDLAKSFEFVKIKAHELHDDFQSDDIGVFRARVLPGKGYVPSER